MRNSLQAITDELRRLKATGVKTVSVSPEAVEQLRGWVKRRAETAPPRSSVSEGPSADASTVTSPPMLEREPTRPAQKAAAEPVERRLPDPPRIELPTGDKATRWESLKQLVLANDVCCGHVRAGKKVVFGVGSLEAPIFFCGEAPGADEEVQGEPFVGPAGQLLTKMIQAMGVRREDVYIGNIMNWRPQMETPAGAEQIGNRPPTAEEMAFCLPFLRAQIEIVQPKVIVALGATAAKGLLGPDSFKAVGEVRGRWHEFAGTPLMVTYHPSYILRNQSNRSKRMIWDDLLKVMEKVGLPISDKQRGYFL